MDPKLDSRPHLLGVTNGVVDLRTGELRERRPDDMVFHICNVEHDPSAPTHLMDTVVLSAMADDREMADYIQKLLGYAITCETNEEIFVIATGSGGNGKSMLMNILSEVLGKNLMSTMCSDLIVAHQVGNMDDEFATISGKRVCVFSDLRVGDRLKLDVVKILSGGDPIPSAANDTAPRCQFILTCNSPPEFDEVDISILDRIVIIPFYVTFLDLAPGKQPTLFRRQCDNDLNAKVKADKAGVFNWLVKGAVAWYATQDLKRNAPFKVKDLTRSYWEKETRAIMMFIK